MRKWLYIAVAVLMAAIVVVIVILSLRVKSLSKERARLQRNTEILISDCVRYRTSDSLSGARVQALELNLKEFERFRAEDAALIRELKARNMDLAAVNKTQSQTIIDLRAVPRDTVVMVRDSIITPAVAVHCGDAWYDFDGVLTKDEFTGKMEHRDSLLLVETVQYKRFLGFLWRTKKVKNRQLDCVSKSPHNSIIGLEYVVIEK